MKIKNRKNTGNTVMNKIYDLEVFQSNNFWITDQNLTTD